MSVHLSPIGNAFQFLTTNGKPLSLGNLYTYAAGTSTPQTTYSDSAGSVPNANPIPLDSSGRLPGEVWLTDGSAYKFVLKDSGGSTVWSYDNIAGIGDPLSITEAAIEALYSASSGASLVGFLQAGTGAVARTLQDKGRDILNVKDFGATGNGSSDDTAAISNAVARAVALGSATIYFPAGIYKITSTISVGDVGGGTFTSISFEGAGAVNTKLQWNGGTTGTMLKWYRNKYSGIKRMGLSNASAAGTTIGLLLTGSAAGTQSNNLVFENVDFSTFGTGCQAGEAGGQAASEITFQNCSFELCGTGYFGSGTGNTLNIWFRGCSFAACTSYGADLGTSGCAYFWGGGSHGNGTATIHCNAAWQAVMIVDGFRAEITPPEVFCDVANIDSAIFRSCLFVTTASVPGYDIIKGSAGFVGLYGCEFGVSGDVGWRTYGNDIGNGLNASIELSGCKIHGTNPFTLGASTSGMAYRITGCYYNSAMQPNETGIVEFSNRIPDVISGTATFASASSVAVTINHRENSTYRVVVTGNVNETFWVDGKGVTQFTIHSSNATSTASVDWIVTRL